VDEKDQSWMCSDGEIDYDQLAEKLKQESWAVYFIIVRFLINTCRCRRPNFHVT
jgi:hypothetical protein